MSKSALQQGYVIQNCDGYFWNGSRWIGEWPDAKEYDTSREAKEVARDVRKLAMPGYENAPYGEGWSVMANYGFETEFSLLDVNYNQKTGESSFQEN